MRVRVLNRGFKVDASHGYSIMISCKADEWDGAECRTLRETAFATFEPTRRTDGTVTCRPKRPTDPYREPPREHVCVRRRGPYAAAIDR